MFVRQLVLIFLVLVARSAMAQDADIAQISGDQLDEGYLQWMGHHPTQFPPGSATKVRFPMLDLYSSGVSIYHGENAQQNAVFIRGLPGSIAGVKPNSFRPSLREAIEMIPEFKKREKALLSSQYTLFVITYPNWANCKAQNEAIAELRKRAGKIGMRILEVRLQ